MTWIINFWNIRLIRDVRRFEDVMYLQENVQAEYQGLILQNEDSSRKLCTDIVQKLYTGVLEISQAGKYTVPGGYHLYMNDMKELQNCYMDSQARGCMKHRVLREFLIEQEPRRRDILATDTALNMKAQELAGWEKIVKTTTRNDGIKAFKKQWLTATRYCQCLTESKSFLYLEGE